MRIAKVAQLVERDLAKVEVAGSNPVFRSDPSPKKRGCFFDSSLVFEPECDKEVHTLYSHSHCNAVREQVQSALLPWWWNW